MIRRTLAGAVALTLAAPAAAAAQTPPALPKPFLAAKAHGALRDGKRLVTLPRRGVLVRGTLRPAPAGEHVLLRVFRGGKLVRRRAPVVAADGSFAIHLPVTKPGRLVLRVTHPTSASLAKGAARPVRVTVVEPTLRPGERGALVRLLQRRLKALHYAVPRTGVYDAGTERAVLAWRKVARLPRTFTADATVFRGLLAGRGAFKVRHPGDGHHVEARLDLQVLALIAHGKVDRIYHTSSGKPSTPTVLGRYRVYRKDPGYNSEGMFDSNYFIRGYAIHGYASVPAFAASHGCLRVPIADAPSIYAWLRMGDVVWVEPS
jgi:L,D-transpeptidase-like protein/putative peptidoglycan binding protein